MANIKRNLVEVIGRTPLLWLDSLSKDLPGNIAAKLECHNPMRSIKDRPALAMIESAELLGLIRKGDTIIEATSGNTGIALAFICAAKGYRLIIVMPENMDLENQRMLEILGAEVHLTPAKEFMKGAIDKALELEEKTPNAYMPKQFNNPANPKAHFDLTGPEIWDACDGEVEVFVAGVGTGGTITGVGQYLKARRQEIRVVAVEPKESAVISGKEPGAHRIQGIGAGFVPENLDLDVIDEVMTANYAEASKMCQRLAKEEGLLLGTSAGANLVSAVELASREEYADCLIVTVLCDTGERYIRSGLFDEVKS
jgi:cysteine synthase A